MKYDEKIGQMIESAEFLFDDADSILSSASENEREQLDNVKSWSLNIANQLRKLKSQISENRKNIEV